MDTGYVRVDGSYGEGGGQILRTAVALSAILNRPIEVFNIRAKRDNPGLRPQHVAAVRAVATLCNARVEGLYVGSNVIHFQPNRVRPSSFSLDLGSAGSITLVLQAVIPASCLSSGEVNLEIRGGTDVRWSPTVNYFQYVTLPAFRIIGVDVELKVLKRGYYPKGGGSVKVKIKPTSILKGIDLVDIQKPDPSVISVCSNLPRHVAGRQLKSAVNYLQQKGLRCQVQEALVEESTSPGTSILIYSVGQRGPFIGSDSIGERGKPAEAVGLEAARIFVDEYSSPAPLDRHIGDMLVSLLCLSPQESRFRVSRVTEHLLTNLYVLSLFTGRRYYISESEGGSSIVLIEAGSETSNYI